MKWLLIILCSYLHRIVLRLCTFSTGPGTYPDSWDFAFAHSHLSFLVGLKTSPLLCLHAQTDLHQCTWDKPQVATVLNLRISRGNNIESAVSGVLYVGLREQWHSFQFRCSYRCSVSSTFLWTACLEEQTPLLRSSHLQQRTWPVCWH